MHHFVNLVPTYESIAGSEQLGPNVFWTMAVLRYVSITQDLTWARKIFPYIDLSVRFLITFFDSSCDLLSAPGPLWIDVIVRENYTSDSNAIIVPLFSEVADFYDMLQVDHEFSVLLRSLSSRVSAAMNTLLWSNGNKMKGANSTDTSGDHFITQLNYDNTTRDFVDYDSNLIAVAFGVVTPERAATILNRVDNGEFTHIRGIVTDSIITYI
jgi:hypothetical protein